MNVDPETAATIIGKLVGSLAGSILSLVFLPPKNRREFARRFVASMIGGMVFVDPVRSFWSWPAVFEYHMAAATIAAFGIWAAMGAGYKAIRAYKAKG